MVMVKYLSYCAQVTNLVVNAGLHISLSSGWRKSLPQNLYSGCLFEAYAQFSLCDYEKSRMPLMVVRSLALEESPQADPVSEGHYSFRSYVLQHSTATFSVVIDQCLQVRYGSSQGIADQPNRCIMKRHVSILQLVILSERWTLNVEGLNPKACSSPGSKSCKLSETHALRCREVI